LLTSEFDNFNFSLPHYYESGPNLFVYYGFTDPVFIPSGNFYIGTLQQSDVSLNFGLDKNTNANSTQLLYQLQGTDVWTPSSISGSVMIRPVFRSTLTDWVGMQTTEGDQTASLFPNPAHDEMHLRIPDSDGFCEYTIVDITGKSVLSGTANNQSIVRIPTDGLSQGSYILRYSNSNLEQYSIHFVKQ
jgi:hypothetical protein